MISFEHFQDILSELAERIPQELYRDLNGGVIAREARLVHPNARNEDLFILGEYHVDPYLGRFVVLYYGSFMSAYGWLPEEQLRERMWHTLRHEFLHHLESLAGERDLEIQDRVQLEEYLRGVRHH